MSKLTTRIEKVSLADLELLEVNARFMRHEMFRRLVENVKRDGVLTSVPFCVKVPGSRPKKYRVISGNHRVSAAIEAGIVEAECMLCDDKLSESQLVALQLAHNAIEGEDDPAVLAQLYTSLDEVDWREYTGLDDKVLGLIDQVKIGALSEAGLDWGSVTIMFMPEDLDRAEAAMADALDSINRKDRIWLARYDEWDRLLTALAEASSSYDVHNHATALDVILTVFEAHRHELKAGFLAELKTRSSGQEKRIWVPLSVVFGNDHVPAPVAEQLVKLTDSLVASGEVPKGKRWKALDVIATAFHEARTAPDAPPVGGEPEAVAGPDAEEAKSATQGRAARSAAPTKKRTRGGGKTRPASTGRRSKAT